MILRLLFSTLLVWASFQTKVQGQKNEYKIDSVFVYKNFDQCGTTANLWQNHRVLDSLKYAKRKFSQEDIKNLDDMLKLFKTKRLLQQKYGGEICYLIIYRNGIGKRFVAYISQDFCTLDDLDSMKRWKTKSPKQAEQFYELINKNWRQ